MTSALFEVNKKYWTDRAPSYSQVNQEELAGCQRSNCCLLYTSDAADDLLCVDLGGSRIIIKKNDYIIPFLAHE